MKGSGKAQGLSPLDRHKMGIGGGCTFNCIADLLHMILYTILHSTILDYRLYCSILYCVISYSVLLYCIRLHCLVFYCSSLCYLALPYIMYCITLLLSVLSSKS